MTKRYDEAIEVTPDPIERSAPAAFVWRGRRYDVDQHLMSWREGGEWWLGGTAGQTRDRLGGTAGQTRDRLGGTAESNGVREREYFRVLARPAGMLATGDLDSDGCMQSFAAVYDVYRDRAAGGWRLVRLWD